MPSLEVIAGWVGGTLEGPSDLEIRDLLPLADAGPHDLIFVKDARHAARLEGSRAGAVLCRTDVDVGALPAVRVQNPRLAAAAIIHRLHPRPLPEPGRHPQSAIADDAVVPDSCSIAAFAVVEAGAQLGERVQIDAHVVVGRDCRVGDDTRLCAGVVLYDGVSVGARCGIHAGAVIGSSGFGYEMGPDGPVSFPQRGTVVLGDDVRVGANTTIDRSAFGATTVGDGTKLDNLVQIGHNVTIADGVVICALAGVGGGACFEEGSVLGPQGALAPDATLGRGTILGARGALQSHGRLDGPGRVFMGTPPIPVEDWRRWVVLRRRLKRRKKDFS